MSPAIAEPELDDLPVAGDHVVVGERYLVPCVDGIPVVGDPHVDAEHFNNTPLHYHCDSRFHDQRYDVELCATLVSEMFPQHPVLEPRVCLRDTPVKWERGTGGTTLMSLYLKYGFTQSKCGVCPHKLMPINNGICSGHRLEWSKGGTIRHRPPYTFSLFGSANKIVVSEPLELKKLTIPIVEYMPGSSRRYLSMHSSMGHEIAYTTIYDNPALCVGDTFTINFK